ncbi:invasion associated locus B family protein [Pseudoruegeria sp. HB172150]|uniref:invasion associated locus B family protein n=1 Tax=Pseudoruegeria sp. HB172150 TaxID=2721164 RepID=UPI0020A69DCB|nr:invasion associated locus B family protein [Pseudoruegeria sp. HB172150]
MYAAVVALPAMAGAQEESRNRVAAHTDWSVFEKPESCSTDVGDGGECPADSVLPHQCWSVSAPEETVNTRDGRVVAVRRGDILLFVSFVPNSNVAGQISFTGGYPFDDGSTVTLTVGDNSFDLFTQGEMAWAQDESDDARIIEAMKAGAEAVLVGESSRGTKTEDTFSLFGFTAAVDEAAERCSS